MFPYAVLEVIRNPRQKKGGCVSLPTLHKGTFVLPLYFFISLVERTGWGFTQLGWEPPLFSPPTFCPCFLDHRGTSLSPPPANMRARAIWEIKGKRRKRRRRKRENFLPTRNKKVQELPQRRCCSEKHLFLTLVSHLPFPRHPINSNHTEKKIEEIHCPQNKA